MLKHKAGDTIIYKPEHQYDVGIPAGDGTPLSGKETPTVVLKILAVGHVQPGDLSQSDAYLCKPAGCYPGTELKQMSKWVQREGKAAGLAPEDRVILVYEDTVVGNVRAVRVVAAGDVT